MISWTDDKTERLPKLWKGGMTALAIAEELGGFEGMTPEHVRGAIMAKLDEVGALGRKAPAAGAKSAPKVPAARSKAARAATQREAVEDVFAGGDEALDNAGADDWEIPVEQRRSLIELGSDECKWPVGEPRSPGFFFCGAKRADGLPYCAHHARVAYNRPPDRRRVAA